MKLGYHGFGLGVTATPAAAARVARHAETIGYESLWTGEHVVLPSPQAPPSPAPPELPFLDPAVALSLCRRGDRAHQARHRHHHPAAAQSAGAGEGARERRRAVVGPADLRHRRRLSESRVRRSGRPVREQGGAHRRVPRSHRRACGRRASRPTPGASSPSPASTRSLGRCRSPIRPSSSAVTATAPSGAPSAPATGGTATSRTSKAPGSAWPDSTAAAREVDRPAGLGRLEISVTPRLGFTVDDAKRYAEHGGRSPHSEQQSADRGRADRLPVADGGDLGRRQRDWIAGSADHGDRAALVAIRAIPRTHPRSSRAARIECRHDPY